MKTVELGTLASISTGKSNVVDATNTGKYPFYDRSQVVKRSNRYLFDVPSAIIVPGEGTSFIPRLAHGKFDLHQRAYAVIPNEKAHAEYLYYAILNAHKYFLMVSAGSTVPSLRLGMFEHMPILLPPLPEQKRIAGVLGAIDEKIEVNRAKINSLSLLAQSIYDYWFVQFDFPNENGKPYKSSNGKLAFNPTLKRYIPANWSVQPLSELAEITMGQSPSGKNMNENGVGTPFFQGSKDFGNVAPTKRVYTTEVTRRAKAGDILLSVRAPVGDMNVALEDCCIGRGLASLRGKTCSTAFVQQVLIKVKQRFDRVNKDGTTFGSLSSDDLKDMMVAIPNKELLTKFDSIASKLFEQVLLLEEEVRSLEGMRDELLPLLMNGQLQILTLK